MLLTTRLVLGGCLLWLAGVPTAAVAQEGACPHTGGISLEIETPAAALPARIDLGCRNGRHWGRFLAVLRDTFSIVLAERGREGDSVRFTSFGGATGATMRVRGDSVSGTLFTGRPLSFRGVYSTRNAPAWIPSHGVLDPWRGLPAPADSGQSYPVPLGSDSLLFTRHGGALGWQRIMVAVRREGRWTARPLVPALREDESQRGPAVAPDGSLWFASTRPDSAGGAVAPRYRLWTAERREGGWKTPRRAGLIPAETGGGDQQPSVTRDGWVYFTAHRPTGLGDRDVWRYRPSDPESTLEVLPAPINGPGDEHGVWVSPDHRMMILSSSGPRPGRVGGDDLYFVPGEAGRWQDPRPLPIPINSFGNEFGATISQDGHTLWFASDRFGIAELFSVDLSDAGVALP